ncbi:MAG: cell envelope integrity protein CreD [Bacteroidota bacterium]
MNDQTNSTIDKINSWIKNSISLKLITVTILMLLLLIPSAMIKEIIRERELLNTQAVHEVSSKWANQQEIHGPVLSIPMVYEFEKEEEKEGKEEVSLVTITKFWHILPDELNIDGEVTPEKLKRGIYEIVVYTSDLGVSGYFKIPEIPDQTNLKEVQYDKAFITLGISDLRGIEDQIQLLWGEQELTAQSGSNVSNMIYSGVTFNVPDIKELGEDSIEFKMNMKLQGSQNLSFIPVGKTTKVNLNSNWPSPKFDGNFLPDDRDVSKDGFTAEWKILQLNRNFPQTWVGSNHAKKMKDSSFRVDLIMPLDDYQKSMRSAKYAAMTIALTFLIFFLVEILNGRKIHPFQYVLVGLALLLFYVLLVSISEHSNFNMAYSVTAVAVVTMITLYSLTIFKARKLTMLLAAVLVGIYGFLFVTLQLTDYALLMGSIGLTLILGLTMYFTRNVNWYKLNSKEE